MAKFFKSTLSLLGAIFVFLIFVMFIPQTCRVGIDADVIVYTIPVYAKLGGFFYRDYEYRRIAREITTGIKADRNKTLAIYRWTIEHIKKDVPRDFPDMDDHILNIIIRGYGTPGQMADVFTALCAYSGMKSFYEGYRVKDPATGRSAASLFLSFVNLNDKWVIFDVYHGEYFLNDSGQMADVNELINNPGLVRKRIGDLKIKGIEYLEFFKLVKPITDTEYLRPEKQMPGRRILFEMSKILKR
jgi:hypothetical protein